MSYQRHEPLPLPAYTQGQPNPPLPARRPRPPLTKRMRPWHWMAIDYLVGVMAGLAGVLATVQDALGAIQATSRDGGAS
jgi:hypothetical protein